MPSQDDRSSQSASEGALPVFVPASQTIDIFSQFANNDLQTSSPILRSVVNDDDTRNAVLSSELGDLDVTPDSDLTYLPPSVAPASHRLGPQYQWPNIGWDSVGTMETWIETLQTKGDAALVELLIQADQNSLNAQQRAQSPLLKVSETRAKINGTVILANLTTDAKIALIRRNLIQRYDTEAKRVLTARLPKTKDAVQIPKPPGGSKNTALKDKENRPSIYAFFHANAAGIAPSKRDYEEVIRVLKIYLLQALKYDASARNQNLRSSAASRSQTQADIDLIKRVDSYVSTGRPSWSVVNSDRRRPIVTRAEVDDAYDRGARRYITTDNTADHIQTWITAMEALLDLIPTGKEDDPIPWHVSEVGWTVEPIIRIANHERHTSSNDILNVVESVAGIVLNKDKYDFRQLKLQFRMRSVILYHVPAGHLVSTAEHLFSVLLRSYVWQGGLNAVIGGNQVHTRKHVVSVVWEKWEEKMPWSAIRGRFRGDGEKMQEQWEVLEAVGLSTENRRERDAVKKKHQDAQDSLNAAKQRVLLVDREVEDRTRNFVQLALEDAKTAKAARDARELTRDLIEILKHADVGISAPYERGSKALSAARSRAFGHSLDILLKEDAFWQSEVSMARLLPEINARTAHRDFVSEEAWVALNAMQHLRPAKIKIQKTGSATVVVRA